MTYEHFPPQSTYARVSLWLKHSKCLAFIIKDGAETALTIVNFLENNAHVF